MNHTPLNQEKDYLVLYMKQLFAAFLSFKKNKGVHHSKKLMSKIRKLNELFDNDDHHDSHEFLNYMLNEIHE